MGNHSLLHGNLPNPGRNLHLQPRKADSSQQSHSDYLLKGTSPNTVVLRISASIYVFEGQNSVHNTNDYLRQWSPTCLAPGTAFVADKFSPAGVGGRVLGSPGIYLLLCSLVPVAWGLGTPKRFSPEKSKGLGDSG